jgi:hypothetical protein
MASRRAAHSSRRRAWLHMTRTVKVLPQQPGGGGTGGGKAAKAVKAAKAQKP